MNRPNGHPSYLLLLVKTSARFYIEGDWITTAPNVAFFFKPGQNHQYCANHSTYTNSWAHITSQQPLLGHHFPFGLPIELHNPADYYDLFHIICNEFYGSKPQRNSIIHNLLSALLSKIADEINTLEYPSLYYQLSSLRKEIYNHPENNWSASHISKKLDISTGYLHLLYRRFFNTTCINDVIKSRIQSATDLLRYTDLSIEDIAVQCGYHSTEHFIRQFKKEALITPGKYRQGRIIY